MSIYQLFIPFKWKLLFTIFLILFEATTELLFPLFIGLAVEGAINAELLGAIQLGILGLVALFLGAGRRFFDSRFYALVYRALGSQIITKMKAELPTVKAARLAMIGEGVEFMENSLPALFKNTLGMIGVILIIYALNVKVFIGCLVTTVLIFLVYFFTRKITTQLNSAYNDEMERQVDVIHQNEPDLLEVHLKNTMHWNIKLSDLETINFSISWIFLMGFLVLAIVFSIEVGSTEYGILFSLVMYVFQFIESVISLPFFYQSWLRLMEIKERLEAI